MKSKFLFSSAVLGLALAGVQSTQASLIGDALTFRRAYPTEGIDYAPPISTVVTADNSDVVFHPDHVFINPGAAAIRFDLVLSSGFIGNSSIGVFDGFVVEGFDSPILDVSYTEFRAGFVHQLTFDADSISLNLLGRFTTGDWFEIAIKQNPASVPDSGSSATILSLSLLGIARLRRLWT